MAAFIHEQTFKDNLNPPGLFHKVRNIHKTGNLAVRDSTSSTERESLFILQKLFHFLYWLCRYYAKDGRNISALEFDRALVPQPQTANQDLSATAPSVRNPAFPDRRDAPHCRREERQQQTEQQLTALQAEIAALKQQNEAVPDTHDYREADTRRYLIDILLKEAGWNIHQPGWTEYEVQGMPNSTGKGYADWYC